MPTSLGRMIWGFSDASILVDSTFILLRLHYAISEVDQLVTFNCSFEFRDWSITHPWTNSHKSNTLTKWGFSLIHWFVSTRSSSETVRPNRAMMNMINGHSVIQKYSTLNNKQGISHRVKTSCALLDPGLIDIGAHQRLGGVCDYGWA